MAKKITTQILDDTGIIDLAKDLMKDFKEDSIITTLDSGDMGGEIPYWIPTSSTLLNAAIGGGGGIPGGRVIEITGPSSTGKSALCYDIIANAQKMGGIAMYIDTEGSAERTFASVLGVDPKRVVAAQAKTVEELYNKAMKFIEKARSKFGPTIPIVIIGDSVTPPTDDEFDKDMRENPKIADNAKLQRRALRKLVNILSDEKAIFIGINHTVSTAGSQYVKEGTTGGSGWAFFPSLRIKLSNPSKIEGDVKDSTIGIMVRAAIAKSKVDRPFRICNVSLLYDSGIDDIGPLIEFVRTSSPLFGTSSGWYKLGGESLRAAQVLTLMKTSPEALSWLKEVATKMMQFGTTEGLKEYTGPVPTGTTSDLILEDDDFAV